MRSLRRLEKRFNLQQYLERFEDRKTYGDNVAITCPMCEKPDKLWILTKDKRTSEGLMPAGSFVCYFCRDNDNDGVGRGPLQLLQWIEDVDFVDGLRLLANGADTEVEGSFLEAIETAMRSMDEPVVEEPPLPAIELPPHFKRITRTRRPKYLRERGITLKRALRYQLGYCDGGYYKNRLIVPVFLHEQLVSFQARYMKKVPPDGVKKSVFPKGVKTGRMLFNYDRARKQRCVVLVEDPFSAMAVGKQAVATFGTTLSPGQLELLLYSRAEEIVVCWDHDALVKAYKLVDALQEFWTVRVVELPRKTDIDEVPAWKRRELIHNAPTLDAFSAFAGSVRARLAALPL